MSDIKDSGIKITPDLTPRDRSKKPGASKKTAVTIFILFIIIFLGCLYIINVNKYKKVFFPNTYINGINVSEKNIAEVISVINEQIKDYKLRIKSRTDTEEISGRDIELKFNIDDSLNKIIEKQNPYLFIKYLFVAREIKIDEFAIFNEDLLNTKLDLLNIFNESTFVKSLPAHISEYVDGEGYSIVPATLGTEIDVKKAKEHIKEAVYNLKYDIDLAAQEFCLYKSADTKEDEEELKKKLETLNNIVHSEIRYSKLPPLNAKTLQTWIVTDDENNVSIDNDKLSSFVKEVSSSYNTVSRAKTLKTSYGSTVSIRPGNYGWKVNEEAEKEALKSLILSGSVTDREPEYARKAASHGENDYGNTYIEVNLSAQKLFFYKKGKLILESEFVSGNEKRNWNTPSGAYFVTYKQRDAILNGENYSTPVSYWIPFNGNIGFHDAVWRKQFGGDIYKTSGSHGCVNLPPLNAKTLFDNVEEGTPVLCYKLEGTESKASKEESGTAYNKKKTQAETKKAATEKVNNTTAAASSSSEEKLEIIPKSPVRTPKGPGITPIEQKGPGVKSTAPTEIVGPATKIKSTE